MIILFINQITKLHKTQLNNKVNLKSKRHAMEYPFF